MDAGRGGERREEEGDGLERSGRKGAGRGGEEVVERGKGRERWERRGIQGVRTEQVENLKRLRRQKGNLNMR